MDEFRYFARALASRGYAAARQVRRTPIVAIEHETKVLPGEMVQPDGGLDLYEDVQKLFRPIFERGRPAIQCSGWLGYIPLNDQYALEVNPRVPIGNLERLIGLASGYVPRILHKYTRYFAHTLEQPSSLFDVVADQLLMSFDHAWETGALKFYKRQNHVGSQPVGKIDPFGTFWRTGKTGKPTASSAAFFRTPDNAQNRVLRFAFEKLLQRHPQDPDSATQKSRRVHIRRSLDRLSNVGRPTPTQASPRAIAKYIAQLPAKHEHYADALMLAQLVMADVGPSIRGSNHLAILPTILIDMSEVFEAYIRCLFEHRLPSMSEVDVRDGNHAGEKGAKEQLFDNLRPGLDNRPVTPDIVLSSGGKPELIIDVKYKPARDIPDRADINQVVLYGARYACKRVMVVYPSRRNDQNWIGEIGNIGGQTLYTGHVDLEADRIEDEERGFVDAIASLLSA